MVSFAQQVLQLALALLLSVQNNPAVSQAQQQQAISVATQAIELVNQALAEEKAVPVSSDSTTTPTPVVSAGVCDPFLTQTCQNGSTPIFRENDGGCVVVCSTEKEIKTEPLTVIYPAGGEMWAVGSGQTIRWVPLRDKAAAGKIVVSLVSMADPSSERVIATVGSYDSSVSFTVPNCTPANPCSSNFEIAPGKYKIKISGPAAYGISQVFSIAGVTTPPQPINSTDPVVTILSPNGGEVWNNSSRQSITWSYLNIDPTRVIGVYLKFPDGGLCNVGQTVVGAKTWPIVVPPTCTNGISRTITSGQYKAFVTVGDQTGDDFVAKDTSDDYFTVNVYGSQTGYPIRVSKNPALPDGSVIANSISNKIGSYVVYGALTEDTKLNSLTIQTGANGNSLQNLMLKVDGLQYGVTQPTVTANSNYTFAGTLVVPTGSSKIVDVYADVLSTAKAGDTISTNWVSCTGAGLTSYAAVSCPVVVGQTMAVVTQVGSLSVSPTSLSFTTPFGTWATQGLTLTHSGSGAIHWSASSPVWFGFRDSSGRDVTSGTISGNSSQTLTAIGKGDMVGGAGRFTGNLLLSGDFGTSVNIPLTLTATENSNSLPQLSVSMNPALPSQVIVAGSVSSKIGSYVLAASASGQVNIASLLVKVGTSNSTLNNLQLKLGSMSFGQAIPSVSGDGTYAFSGSLVMTAGASQVVDVYADVPGNLAGGTVLTTTLSGCSGVLPNSAQTVSCSPTGGQTMTVTSLSSSAPTVLASLDTTYPSLAQSILMGSTGVLLGNVKVTNTASEDVTLTAIKLTIHSVDGGPRTIINDQLWDGTTIVSTSVDGMNPDNSNDAYHTYHFKVVIPKGTTRVLSIKADVSPYSIQPAALSHSYQLMFDNSSGSVQAFGTTSGLSASFTIGQSTSNPQIITRQGLQGGV